MKEIKISVATGYPQLECSVSKINWKSYKDIEISNFENKLITQFCGFSKQMQQGAYKMNSGKIVVENSLCYTLYAASTELLIPILEDLRDNLFQESILLITTEIEGMEFI
tara:strand:+ start:2324 stop:2653 length:330 start_codon:yes stop_codon:yes gene_type:complete